MAPDEFFDYRWHEGASFGGNRCAVSSNCLLCHRLGNCVDKYGGPGDDS
jgi:hypothetical protein